MIHNSLQFAFFGTDEFSVIVLNELKNVGFIPALVVTAPDTRKGRGLKLTPPPVKVWAEKFGIKFLQPQKLDTNFVSQMSNVKCQMFIVASYGKVLTKEILAIPERGALNVHPSLLPLYRGPSPIQSQMLDGVETTGVTIMFMNEKIDHGPIVAQQVSGFKIYDLRFKKLRDELARLGGKLLAQTIPDWVAGNIDTQEQDHIAATYSKKIKKEDGLMRLSDNPELNYRKFLAYSDWPSAYFFQNGKRIKITDAELKDGQFIIKKIISEGKKEISYTDLKKHF